MLALVDKPLIQYGVEEALAAGMRRDHHRHQPREIRHRRPLRHELRSWNASLEARGKTELLELTRKVSNMVLVSYVRQKEPLGLGHAVLQARDMVGDEPFAVILPDDIIDATTPCLKQMADVFEQVQSSILATQIVEGPAISSYGVLDCDPVKDNPRLHAVKAWSKSRSKPTRLEECDHWPLHSDATQSSSCSRAFPKAQAERSS